MRARDPRTGSERKPRHAVQSGRDDGIALDAHLDIEGREVVFHSRGGVRGRAGARNMDYGVGLRAILTRLREASMPLAGAWLDSDEVRNLPREQRVLLDGADFHAPVAEQFRLLSSRMQAFGRPEGAPYGGSRVKRVRLTTTPSPSGAGLAVVLRLEPIEGGPGRGPKAVSRLESVDAEHVWTAVQSLRAKGSTVTSEPSPLFEVLVGEGARLSTRAVFARAVAEATKTPLGEIRFADSPGSVAHRRIREAGFVIVPVGTADESPTPPPGDEREWAEGQPKLVLHLRRERAPGLAKAKKRSFVRQHGALRCERCGLDPQAVFGPEVGHACIEVRHAKDQVGEMQPDHRTSLDDLQCLCANCHRIVHAMLRIEAMKSRNAQRRREEH